MAKKLFASDLEKQRRVLVVDNKKANTRNLVILTFIVIAVCLAYLLIHSYIGKPKLFQYILSLRIPTLMVMLISAFAIGSASVIFQSIINNRIVTPCLLGMNSMYTLVHTAVVFVVGSGSMIATNSNLSFAIDLIVMAVSATFVYSYMFKKTGNNVLYVLLIGTVLSSLFGSIQSTMIRVMDPNEYDALLTTLVADFTNVNVEVIAFSLILLLFLTIIRGMMGGDYTHLIIEVSIIKLFHQICEKPFALTGEKLLKSIFQGYTYQCFMHKINLNLKKIHTIFCRERVVSWQNLPPL